MPTSRHFVRLSSDSSVAVAADAAAADAATSHSLPLNPVYGPLL